MGQIPAPLPVTPGTTVSLQQQSSSGSPAPIFAYDFQVAVQLSEWELRDRSNVIASITTLCNSARHEEVRVVLHEIVRHAVPYRYVYSLPGVLAAQHRLEGMHPGRQYRLVGTGPVAEDSTRDGVVHDAVDPQTYLEPGVRALMIARIGGPVLQRIESDLTFGWRRVSSRTAEFRVSGRFFITDPGESVVLVDCSGG